MTMESETYLRIAIYGYTNTTTNSNNIFVKYAELLQKSTGIDVKFLDKIDLSFNAKHSNGSWAGLLGMVNRGEADLAMTNFVMNEERLEAVDFLYPFDFTEYTFATKHPAYSPEMFALSNPFLVSVWITLELSLILISGISFLAFAKNYLLDKVLFHHFAAIIGQTTKMKFPNMCCRLISFSWIFGMMLLANCYKSVLLSFLTVPTLEGVRDFKELAAAVEKGRYQCIVSKLTVLSSILLNSGVKIWSILAKNIEESPMGYGDLEVFLQNYRGNVAYLASRNLIMFLNRKFFISNDRINPVLYAYAVRKNLFCKRELDTAVLKIADSGLFVKLFNDFMFRKALTTFSSLSDDEEATIRMLSLFEVSGIFIILICGYFVAAIALAIEIFYYKYH